MTNKRAAITAILLFFAVVVWAQDTLATQIDYELTAETAVGTGDYTAFQVAANRYHVLGTRANTGYLRGAVSLEHPFTADLRLSATVDALAGVHADHKAYLQQAYVNLSYQQFFIEAGSREIKQVLRHERLSSGSFILGSNAKPVPQVRVGTDGFWTVPYTAGWLQISFDCGYGKLMDDGYREDRFRAAPGVNKVYADDVLYHQKYLYLRTNPDKRVFFTAGMEHVVQFGGTGYSYVDGVLTGKKKPSNVKAALNVFLPFGDSQFYEHESLEDWIYGNHIGMMTVQLGWNIDNKRLLQAYVDNPFEDGSGIRKGNGWDGLWGLQYTTRAEGVQPFRGIVAEYFQSSNQSGPLHWDSRDYPEPIRSQITDYVTGDDDYYNHSFYDSYAYYGMSPGTGLIASPRYNKDGYTAYHDNRVKAWHLGVEGELTDRLSYLVKGSYREGWGTYHAPLPTRHHSFDAMLQGCYSLGPWQFSAAYAFDKGNIYGDNSTFNLKIGYHGKIL
ncbi:MAG: hypothetical protein IKQ05_01890 [Prevotella sp.]|nr:hypothetical protein [Prevotella sp.]